MSTSPSAPPNSERGYHSARFLGFHHEEAGRLEYGDFHSFVRSLLWRFQSASEGPGSYIFRKFAHLQRTR